MVFLIMGSVLPGYKQTNKQKFKVRQPQRAARSKRPNTPSDGSKNNGCHTTNQEEYPSRHPTTETANSAQKTNPSPGGSRWFQSKYNAEHQPSKMSGKSTSSVPPKMSRAPSKAKTQAYIHLDFNQFLIRRTTRMICLRLRIKEIQILTCREQDIR